MMKFRLTLAGHLKVTNKTRTFCLVSACNIIYTKFSTLTDEVCTIFAILEFFRYQQ